MRRRWSYPAGIFCISKLAVSAPSVVSYSLVIPPEPLEPPAPGVTWTQTKPDEPEVLEDKARPMEVPIDGLLVGVTCPVVELVTNWSPIATAAVSAVTW